MLEHSFRVTQSSYYLDFETGTPREIDLLCRLYEFYEPPVGIRISELEIFCAVECKSSNSPWVIFRQAVANPWTTDYTIPSNTGKLLLKKARKSLQGAKLQLLGGRAGHGARESFSENDRIFKAMMSALKAAEAKILASNLYDERKKEADDDLANAYSALAIPLVVTNAPMFECTLEDTGKLKLNSVDISAVVLRYPRNREGTREGAVVYIVTEEGLSKFTEFVTEYIELLKPSLGALLAAGKSLEK